MIVMMILMIIITVNATVMATHIKVERKKIQYTILQMRPEMAYNSGFIW